MRSLRYTTGRCVSVSDLMRLGLGALQESDDWLEPGWLNQVQVCDGVNGISGRVSRETKEKLVHIAIESDNSLGKVVGYAAEFFAEYGAPDQVSELISAQQNRIDELQRRLSQVTDSPCPACGGSGTTEGEP